MPPRTVNKKDGGREVDGRKEGDRIRELTAGWYSWGLASQADGAEWTSPRNFNVHETTRWLQSQSPQLQLKAIIPHKNSPFG